MSGSIYSGGVIDQPIHAKMQLLKAAVNLAFGFLFALVASLSAQETRTRSLAVTGEDLCTVLGLGIHKEEISFGAPKTLSLRILSRGQQTDSSLEMPATSKVTVMIYFPSGSDHMQYWLKTAQQVHSGTIYFKEKQAAFTEFGLVDGVYTIKGSDSEDDLQKRPAWMVSLLASDPPPTAQDAKEKMR